MEESVNREFITDMLTIAAIAVSIWLTGERDGKVPEMRMVGSLGELPKQGMGGKDDV